MIGILLLLLLLKTRPFSRPPSYHKSKFVHLTSSYKHCNRTRSTNKHCYAEFSTFPKFPYISTFKTRWNNIVPRIKPSELALNMQAQNRNNASNHCWKNLKVFSRNKMYVLVTFFSFLGFNIWYDNIHKPLSIMIVTYVFCCLQRVGLHNF